MELYLTALKGVVEQSGFVALNGPTLIMLLVSFILLYLAIAKGFEPLLLMPIAFGCLLVNLPLSGIVDPGGFLYFVKVGIDHELYPVIIFMGIGALTDFGPLLANPITFLLGAAAQIGVFFAVIGAMFMGFTIQEAAGIGIIGGADGPTAIYLCAKLAKDILPAVAVAAYSYMSLVPLIQPPIIKMLTTKEDRAIKMEQLRPVSRTERILFPIISTIACGLVLPASVPLIGMLMFGNLLRECGCTDRLSLAAQNEVLNATTIFLGISVGATMSADSFLTLATIKIICLGLIAFNDGVNRASSTSFKVFVNQLKNSFLFGIKVNAFIVSLSVICLIIANYTPITEWIAIPMSPILNLLGLADAEKIAASSVVGIFALSLPATLIAGKGVAAASAFFIIVLSTCQIIFFTESANAMLESDIPLNFWTLVSIFCIRTVILIPLVALLTNIMI